MSKSLMDATILVAEDEIVSLEMVARVLKRLPVAHVLKAKDGIEALERIEHAGKAIDAAVVDFNMPRLHGLQLLKRIRTGETAAPVGLPCIMLTGSDDSRLLGLASALGADAFLRKPATFDELKTQLEGVLSEAALRATPDVYRQIDVDAPMETILERIVAYETHV